MKPRSDIRVAPPRTSRSSSAAAFGPLVECRLVDTCDRETMLRWGQADALFVDGRRVRTGPPPSEEKLAALIRRRVRRLRGRDAPPPEP